MKNRNGVSVADLVVCFIILSLLAGIVFGLLVPALSAARDSYQEVQTATETFTSDDPTVNPVRSVTQFSFHDRLVTIEHDGCWFVVSDRNRVSLIHHPRCPKCRGEVK